MAPLMQPIRLNPFRAVRRHPAKALVPSAMLALALLLPPPAEAQMVINTSGQPPISDQAILELSSVTQGLLMPRMTQVQRTGIPAPVPNGLLVYQTNSTGTELSGLYYYDSYVPPLATGPMGWVRLGLGGRIWQLGGNTATNMNTDFLGTVNNYPLVLRTRNRENGRLTEHGKLQLYGGSYPAGLIGVYGSNNNTELVHVQGAVKLNGGNNPANTANANLAGTIRFNPGVGDEQPRFEGFVNNAPATNEAIHGWKQIDNNFHVRKIQESTNTAGGCQPPSSTTGPATNPRPWPMPGPLSGFGTLIGYGVPYYGLWEDSRKQYLYRGEDIAATGLCPGPTNLITAIAFNVQGTISNAARRQHFFYVRIKNSSDVAITAFDNSGLIPFAEPMVGLDWTNPLRYYDPYPPANLTFPPNGFGKGYQITLGWNVHPYDIGGAGFYWLGQNILVDVSTDNQDWPTGEGNVQAYNSGYPSMIYMYSDAAGNGLFSCLWQTAPPAGFYYPPTTPTNGAAGTPGAVVDGWGWVAARHLTNGTNTVSCDGDPSQWSGGGPVISNQLPRVAFLASYTGGGAAMDVSDYMYANEGLLVGDAAWAASGTFGPPSTLQHRGPGTINAQRSVWSDNVLITDYVFDLYYDGEAKPEDAKGASTYDRVPLRDLPNYVERNRKLPNVDGRKTWKEEGPFSLDQITSQLWVAVEDQALYIKELNERMDALRQYLVEKKLEETGRK